IHLRLRDHLPDSDGDRIFGHMVILGHPAATVIDHDHVRWLAECLCVVIVSAILDLNHGAGRGGEHVDSVVALLPVVWKNVPAVVAVIAIGPAAEILANTGGS